LPGLLQFINDHCTATSKKEEENKPQATVMIRQLNFTNKVKFNNIGEREQTTEEKRKESSRLEIMKMHKKTLLLDCVITKINY